MKWIITPKTFLWEDDITSPVVFLGWPIRNAPNRHEEAMKFFLNQNVDIIIVNPAARELTEDFQKFKIKNDESFLANNPDYLEKYITNERQRSWERYYLDIARKVWVILFYLPWENKKDTPNYCEWKVYGAMTRTELWAELAKYNWNLVIWTDGNFSEMRTLEIDIKIDASNLVIQSGLIHSCEEVMRILK